MIEFLVNLIEGIQAAIALGGKDLFQAMINNGFASKLLVIAVGFELVWIFVEILLEEDLPGGIGLFVKTVVISVICWTLILPANYDKIATAITNGSDVIVAQIGSVSKSGSQTPMQIIAESIGNGMQLKGDYEPKPPNTPSEKAKEALPIPGMP
jgi:hypothetical protein